MAATHLIAARGSPETKAQFRTARTTAAGDGVGAAEAPSWSRRERRRPERWVLRPTRRQPRGSRLCVRLHPDDQRLLNKPLDGTMKKLDAPKGSH